MPTRAKKVPLPAFGAMALIETILAILLKIGHFSMKLLDAIGRPQRISSHAVYLAALKQSTVM